MLRSGDNEPEIDSSVSRWQIRHHPAAIGAMAAVLVILLALTAFRTYKTYSVPSKTFDWTNRGFSDFHNGTYLPTRAFIDGKSPYAQDVADEYNMSRPTPPYSPVIFLLHLPFGWLPLWLSAVLFFVFNAGLLMILAFCGLKMSGQPVRWFDLLALTCMLLISRPGHITLYTGYFTAEIVIGCLIALHFAKQRPEVSGLGLVLASIKPNFVIPLILLMLFRKNFRAVMFGLVFCAIPAGLGLGWLSYNSGFDQVIQDVRGGQEALHEDPSEMPINSWTRVDLLGMYAKIVDWVPGDAANLSAMLVFTAFVGICLIRIVDQETNPGATGLSAVIAALAILLSLYHHSYDCLLLSVPCFGILLFGKTTIPEIHTGYRVVVGILIALPAVNYISTKTVMELFALEPMSFWWQAIAMINGLCLLVAMLVLMTASFMIRRPAPIEEQS